MSKKISFRGTLPVGEQDQIRLKTNTGKVGYKITKFQLMQTNPGNIDHEFVGKIFKTNQTGSIDGEVQMTDSDLLAAIYKKTESTGGSGVYQESVIFDNEVFNQDIFVTIVDNAGSVEPCNYYIELETMALTDLETTKLTLQSIRQITS
tara:strand:- start:45 stop:491 length:447 start_codon:yes stop_codon:yes gene_type:complete